MFSGCASVCPSVRSFIRSYGQMLLPRYLMNGLRNLGETQRKHSLAPTDDLIRFRRSKVKVTADRRGGEVVHVDAAASIYI